MDGRLNADIVGQTPQRLGEIFDIQVPKWAKVLIGEVRLSQPRLVFWEGGVWSGRGGGAGV